MKKYFINDSLNTFHMRLYDVEHIVENHYLDCSVQLLAMDRLYAPSHRQDRRTKAFVINEREALAGTRNSSIALTHGIDPTTHRTKSRRSTTELHLAPNIFYFLFQPVLHDWCYKGRGMYYPVGGMMHIKEPLLLIGSSSLCGGSGFPLSLYEWSFTICPTPYNRK